MASAMLQSSGRTFEHGSNHELFPPDPGTAPDWAYGILGVRATMTVELEGTYHDPSSFCLGRENIVSVGEEQLAGVLALMQYLRAHGDEPSTLVGVFQREVAHTLPV